MLSCVTLFCCGARCRTHGPTPMLGMNSTMGIYTQLWISVKEENRKEKEEESRNRLAVCDGGSPRLTYLHLQAPWKHASGPESVSRNF